MTTTTDTIILKYGNHTTRAHGMCAMEFVAYLANEEHSDRPVCACPVISAFVRRFNDRLPDDATRSRLLGPLLPLLVGSRSTPEVERKRAYICADWAVRDMAARALESAGLADEAATLRALEPIIDKLTAYKDRDAARKARSAAYAAYAAAAAAAAADYSAAAADYSAADYSDAYSAAAAAAAAAADYSDAADAAADAYSAAADAAADAYSDAAADYSAAADAAAREPFWLSGVDLIRRLCEVKA